MHKQVRPAREGLAKTKTCNATLTAGHPHFHTLPFNLRYVLKSLEDCLHVLVVDQLQYFLCAQLCSPFGKKFLSFQFHPTLCLAFQCWICQSGEVKLEGGAEAEALGRSITIILCAKKVYNNASVIYRSSSWATKYLWRANYHWREVKTVDPQGCHSGHLKIWLWWS